jgi:hypothetical protein
VEYQARDLHNNVLATRSNYREARADGLTIAASRGVPQIRVFSRANDGAWNPVDDEPIENPDFDADFPRGA